MDEREVDSIGQEIAPTAPSQSDIMAMLKEAEKQAEADYEIRHSGPARAVRIPLVGTRGEPSQLAFSVSPVEGGVVVTIPFSVIPEEFQTWWGFVGTMVTSCRASRSDGTHAAQPQTGNGTLPHPEPLPMETELPGEILDIPPDSSGVPSSDP